MERHIIKCIKRPLNFPEFEGMNYEIIASEPGASECELTRVVPPSVAVPTSLTTSESGVTNVVFSDIETASSSSVYFPEVIKPQVRKHINTLKTFIDSISDADNAKLDAAFARAIYSSNCPLSLTDNPYWKEFLNLIRPSYRIPTRNDITNNLLENEYLRVMEIQKEKIKKSEFVSILTDGWSNIRNEGIISYVLTTPSPVFYKSFSKTHTVLRNRLSNDRVSKLIAIRSSLTIQNKLSELSEILDCDMD